MKPKIISIGAGKGGVGKTFVASSIGITLAKLGSSVLLIDCDLAGANVHTTLGLPTSETTLLSYLKKESSLLNLVQPTTIPRLSYIHGVWDNWAAAEMTSESAQKIIADVKELSFDYIVIDLGPGATPAHLEIFKNSDEKILISSAEPTSIEKTYRFIEAYVVSKIEASATQGAISKLRQDLVNYRRLHKKGHFSFRRYLTEVTGFSFDYFESLNEKPIRFILNGSRSHLDQQLGYSIKSVCNKYFDLEVNYSGHIDYDNAVWQSVRNCEPFLISMPFTPLSGQFLSICKNIMGAEIGAIPSRAVI